MKIIELVLDEENLQDDNGISAISIVESPAIEEDFIALKNQEFKFAEQDKEKKLLLGAALVPNRPIFRKDSTGSEDYYIFLVLKQSGKQVNCFSLKGINQIALWSIRAI